MQQMECCAGFRFLECGVLVCEFCLGNADLEEDWWNTARWGLDRRKMDDRLATCRWKRSCWLIALVWLLLQQKSDMIIGWSTFEQFEVSRLTLEATPSLYARPSEMRIISSVCRLIHSCFMSVPMAQNLRLSRPPTFLMSRTYIFLAIRRPRSRDHVGSLFLLGI